MYDIEVFYAPLAGSEDPKGHMDVDNIGTAPESHIRVADTTAAPGRLLVKVGHSATQHASSQAPKSFQN